MATKACSVCGAPTGSQATRCAQHPKATYGRPHRRAAAPVLAGATRCHWCNTPFTPDNPPVADHLTPLALGGQHVPGNYRASCAACNARRGAPRNQEN